MPPTISLSHISHPNATRMEYFLNSLEVELKEVPYDWKQLKLSEYISAAIRYHSVTENPYTITVFFCDSYEEANEIAEANQFPYTETAKWSLNGDLMYLVECDDPEKVSSILGLFAGEE